MGDVFIVFKPHTQQSPKQSSNSGCKKPMPVGGNGEEDGDDFNAKKNSTDR